MPSGAGAGRSLADLALPTQAGQTICESISFVFTGVHHLQINASAERTISLPRLFPMSIRVSVLKVLDRVNQIRPAQGIGILQAAAALIDHPWREPLGILPCRSSFVHRPRRRAPADMFQSSDECWQVR